MGLSFIIISYFSIKNALNEIYSQSVKQEVIFLKNGFDESLDTTLLTMKDYARLPVMISSVMNPRDDHWLLQSLMEDLRVQGEKVKFFLVDINGKIIQTNSTEVKNFLDNQWLEKLIEGTIEEHVEIIKSPDKILLSVAIPVNYNGNPEGVLVGVLPSHLDRLFPGLEQKGNVRVVINSNGLRVHEFGVRKNTDSSKRRVNIPVINGFMELEIYKDKMNSVILELVSTLVVIIILISILFVLFFRKIGKKLFIEPQEFLEQSRLETFTLNEN